MITLEYNKDLIWQSDWNGDEVGYDDVGVVGLYTMLGANMYIDMENNKVLEIWCDEEEE